MANWCINQITIKGEKTHLKKLKTKINDYFDLNREGNKVLFMEYLISLGEIPEDYNVNPGNYNNEWFGTSCDIGMNELHLDIKKNYIFIDADSLWFPIIPFVSKLCKKYKVTSTIDYFEPQGSYGGRAIIDNSGIVKKEEWTYLDALYLYRNKAFRQEQKYYKVDFTTEYYEELIQSQTLLNKKELNKLTIMLQIKKSYLLAKFLLSSIQSRLFWY